MVYVWNSTFKTLGKGTDNLRCSKNFYKNPPPKIVPLKGEDEYPFFLLLPDDEDCSEEFCGKSFEFTGKSTWIYLDPLGLLRRTETGLLRFHRTPWSHSTITLVVPKSPVLSVLVKVISSTHGTPSLGRFPVNPKTGHVSESLASRDGRPSICPRCLRSVHLWFLRTLISTYLVHATGHPLFRRPLSEGFLGSFGVLFAVKTCWWSVSYTFWSNVVTGKTFSKEQGIVRRLSFSSLYHPVDSTLFFSLYRVSPLFCGWYGGKERKGGGHLSGFVWGWPPSKR